MYDLYAADLQRVWKQEGHIILALGDDYAFRVQALDAASAQAAVASTCYYRVNYPVNLPDQPCQNNRSPHGSELPFDFGYVNDQTGFDFIGKPRHAQDDAARNHLMDQMMLAWTASARTGDLNGGDLPEWSLFTGETRPTMVFSVDAHVKNAPFYAEYKAMSDFMKGFNVFDALK